MISRDLDMGSSNIINAGIEIVLGTIDDAAFFSFEEIELKPDQVVWLKTQEGEDYRLRIGEAVGAEAFNIEVRDADILVHAPNGGMIVLRDYAIAAGDKPLADFKDQLFFTQEEDSNEEEMVAKERASEEESIAVESDEEIATDGELFGGEVSASASGNFDPDSAQLGSAEAASSRVEPRASAEREDDSQIAAWFWGASGLLASAGIAYGLDDDGDSVPLPEFAGGDTVQVAVAEGASTSTVIYDADVQNGAGSDSIMYSIGGADAGAFNINSETGEVTLKESADFEVKDSYEIEVNATNGQGGSAIQAISVSVIDVVTSVEGRVIAGPVLAGHGLTVELYDADGELIASADLDDEGRYRFELADDYEGALLVRVRDGDDGADYRHEGSGEAADLTTDLRSIGWVKPGESSVINVNQLTEIMTRRVMNDVGGDAGAAPVKSGENVTEEILEENKQNINEAFGLASEVDIDDHASVAVNEEAYESASAESKTVANVLAALAAADGVDGNGTLPTAAQYAAIGVTGIDTVEEVSLLGDVIDGLSNDAVDTVAEVQALANAVQNVMNSADGVDDADSNPTLDDYAALGITFGFLFDANDFSTGATVDVNSSVSQIDDNGSNLSATQSTASRQPLLVQNGFGSDPILRFDGSNDYLDIPSDVSVNPENRFTIEIQAYIDPNAVGNDGQVAHIVSRTNGGDQGYVVLWDDRGGYGVNALKFFVKGSGGSKQIRVDSAITSAGWYTITATCDNSLASDNMKLYLDGVLIGSEDLTVPITSYTRPLRIGADVTGNYSFNMDLARVSIESDVGPYHENLLGDVIDSLPSTAVDSVAEIQALARSVTNVLNAAAGSAGEPSLADLQALGITGVSSANLATVQGAIAATVDSGAGVDSVAELQAVVDASGSSPPLVLDLAGDGIDYTSLASSNARYDMDGDGERETTAWVASSDALIGFDANGDGLISGREELVLSDYVDGAETDLEGLVAFDSNDNGLFDSDDEQWQSFLVWNDVNGDGVSTSEELQSLDDLGVASISLASDGNHQVLADGSVVEHGRFVVTYTDGTTTLGADASFIYREETYTDPSGGAVL